MRKNGSLVIAMFGAALLVSGSAGTASAQTCGDVAGGGSVNALDCQAIATVVLSGTPVAGHCGGSGTLSCGDLVQDNTINTQDLVACLQIAAGRDTLLEPCTGFGPTLPCGSTLSGTITTNRVVPAGCDTFVDGVTTVSNEAVVTVQPGATVKGRKTSTDGSPSALVFLRGSKINAAGNASQPIVFTSDQSVGTRAPADWGGISLLGNAPANFPGGEGQAEGLPPGTAIFGGNEPNDSSGVVRFARVEFSGALLSEDNELNVFTMNGVGRGTTIEFVQASMGDDDCHEWFGGTVRSKYLVSTGCQDDLFDWQIGFTGAHQFGLGIQYAPVNGDSGFEADNNEFGFDNLPRSNPIFCNMTVIGDRHQGSTDGGAGARLRRGTAGKIANTILHGWATSGIRVDDNATAARGCTGPATLQTTEPVLRVQDSYIFDSGSTGLIQMRPQANSPCTSDQLYAMWHASTGVNPAPGTPGVDPLPSLGATYPNTVDNRFFPVVDGVADNAPDCRLLLPEYFDSAPYVGAFDPKDNPGGNWLVTPGGWLSFAVN